MPNDTFGSVASSPNADRRSGRGRGMLFLTCCIFTLFVFSWNDTLNPAEWLECAPFSLLIL